MKKSKYLHFFLFFYYLFPKAILPHTLGLLQFNKNCYIYRARERERERERDEERERHTHETHI